MQEARRLADDGRMKEALECLDKVRGMCPGSGCENRALEMINEIRTKEQDKNEFPGCCCPLGCMNQAGACWCAQLLDWLTRTGAAGEPNGAETLPGCRPAESGTTLPSGRSVQHAPQYIPPSPRFPLSPELAMSQQTAGDAPANPPVASNVGSHPIVLVLAGQDGSAGMAVPIDLSSPVTLHADNVPLGVVLELLLRSTHATAAGSEQECSHPEEAPPQPKMCGSACPKCEKMHAERAAREALVTGLMKACYLAFGEGRYDKAVELARQAHAVDPARVEADPLLYKMHLLGESCGHEGRRPRIECGPDGIEEK
jgi:hypothetical protein